MKYNQMFFMSSLFLFVSYLITDYNFLIYLALVTIVIAILGLIKEEAYYNGGLE